jgi:hypothetical protein
MTDDGDGTWGTECESQWWEEKANMIKARIHTYTYKDSMIEHTKYYLKMEEEYGTVKEVQQRSKSYQHIHFTHLCKYHNEIPFYN